MWSPKLKLWSSNAEIVESILMHAMIQRRTQLGIVGGRAVESPPPPPQANKKVAKF